MVGIGIIGAGRICAAHATAALALPETELVAIADIDEARLSQATSKYGGKGYPDYREMLGDARVEAVIIGLPHGLHRDVTIDCLRAGKHVLLENIFLLDGQATAELAPGGPCPFLGQEAWVSAVGRFDPCCAPDAQRRSLGEFGNLHQRSLPDIWDGDAYRELVSTYRNRRLCLGCNMRKPAGGVS